MNELVIEQVVEMIGESGMEEIPVKQGLYRNHGDRI